MTTEEKKLLPAFLCNIASRVVWLRRAVKEDPVLRKVAARLERYTAPVPFEKELLSGNMDEVNHAVEQMLLNYSI